MYLARYRNGPTAILQAAFRIEAKLSRLPDFEDGWRERFVRLAGEVVGAGKFDIALRVALREKVLERVLACTADEADQVALERLGRSLEELNGVVPDCVQFCENRKTHDEMLGWFPPARAWNSSHPYPCRDFLLAQNFRLFSALDRLLAAAVQGRWRFAWQANLRRFRLSPEDERAIRKNLVRVEGAGLPPKVRDYQREIVAGLGDVRFLIDEFVGCDEGEARQALTKVLEERFRDTVGQNGFASAPLVWDGGEQMEELLFSGLHSSLLAKPEPLAKASAGVGEDFAKTLLRWKPPVAKPKPAAVPTGTPLPPGVKADVFISYSSKDAATAAAVCAALEEGGRLRCWMAPRDIPPGALWSAAIIEGIEASRVMVLIYSQHSNASQQVLREVERAVNKRLRLIPFRIENLPPCKELEYYISAVHWFDALGGPLAGHCRRLRDAILGVPATAAPAPPPPPTDGPNPPAMTS